MYKDEGGGSWVMRVYRWFSFLSWESGVEFQGSLIAHSSCRLLKNSIALMLKSVFRTFQLDFSSVF